MGDIKDHKRVNDILLGPLERPALQWLAAHLPSMGHPRYHDCHRHHRSIGDHTWLWPQSISPSLSMDVYLGLHN